MVKDMNDFLKNIICEAGYSEERDGDVKYFGKRMNFLFLNILKMKNLKIFLKVRS